MRQGRECAGVRIMSRGRSSVSISVRHSELVGLESRPIGSRQASVSSDEERVSRLAGIMVGKTICACVY